MLDRRNSIRLLWLALLAGAIGIPALAGRRAEPASEKIAWADDLYAAHAKSVETNKPLIVVFGADWCGYCRKLENETLADRQLVAYINETFVPLHLDLNKDERIARILEVRSIPCTIVLSPRADLLGRLVGYVGAARYREVLSQARSVQDKIEAADHNLAEPAAGR